MAFHRAGDELRAFCKANACWAEFCNLRTDLVRSGVKSALALQQAEAQIRRRVAERKGEVLEPDGSPVADIPSKGPPLAACPTGMAYATDPGLFKGRRATRAAEKEWVEAHLEVPGAQLKPSDCPSPAAWALLREAKSNRTWYMTQVFAGVKPSSDDKNGRIRDDGRELLESIARVKRAYESSLIANAAAV